MPALSDTMNVGRLVKWVKKPGDPVKKGEAIAEVETDKAIMDVEAFHDGYLAGPVAAVGAELPLGATLGYITDLPEAATNAESPRPVSTVQALAPGNTAPVAPPSRSQPMAVEAASTPLRASPYARALARSAGVDLAKLANGQPGPIDAAALLNAVHREQSADLEDGPPFRIERASSLREAVARNMTASAAIPTFRLTARLPLEALRRIAHDRHLSLSLLLARACALTIETHPLFNAVYMPAGLAQRERVDIGIAVDIPEGLVTPVLRDAARRPLSELAQDWSALRDRLATRRLKPQDYRGATFYISDLGTFGVVQSFDSIVPSGASAILSIAAACNDEAMFTLSCDHRVIFGADGARFLTTLNDWLTNPEGIVAPT